MIIGLTLIHQCTDRRAAIVIVVAIVAVVFGSKVLRQMQVILEESKALDGIVADVTLVCSPLDTWHICVAQREAMLAVHVLLHRHAKISIVGVLLVGALNRKAFEGYDAVLVLQVRGHKHTRREVFVDPAKVGSVSQTISQVKWCTLQKTAKTINKRAHA